MLYLRETRWTNRWLEWGLKGPPDIKGVIVWPAIGRPMIRTIRLRLVPNSLSRASIDWREPSSEQKTVDLCSARSVRAVRSTANGTTISRSISTRCRDVCRLKQERRGLSCFSLFFCSHPFSRFIQKHRVNTEKDWDFIKWWVYLGVFLSELAWSQAI